MDCYVRCVHCGKIVFKQLPELGAIEIKKGKQIITITGSRLTLKCDRCGATSQYEIGGQSICEKEES